MKPNYALHGKTVVLTGAAGGIGRAIALVFAQAGAAVVMNHLGRAAQAQALVQELQSLGVQAWALEAGVSVAADVDRMLGTDLKSVFLTSRAFLPAMVACQQGVIINIAPAIRVNAIAPGPVNTAMVSRDALSWYYFP